MKVRLFVLMMASALVAAAASSSAAQKTVPAAREDSMTTFQITSSAFASNGDIPSSHTCEGKDVSPALSWSGAPAGTRSLALIVDDPDAPDPKAPKMIWVHWVLYDLPADTHALPEGVNAKNLPKGAAEGTNDFKQAGWRGPCPPVGRHRYFFKLYALDRVLPDLKKPTKATLEKAMEGHVLGRAELMGHYQKAGTK
jgi:Raf kinase inhibitor-like YbhB/YbcL family protein